jgi:TPR repeat protein
MMTLFHNFLALPDYHSHLLINFQDHSFIESLLKQAKNGNAKDYYLIGKTYQAKNDPEQAIHYFKRALAAGYQPRCYYELGRCFELVLSIQKAIRYYKLGADYDHNCLYRLAKLFEQQMELEKAYQYYYLAAKNGNRLAWYDVGRCRKLGIGIKTSAREVFEAFYIGAGEGDVKSYFELSQCYLNGYGTKKLIETGLTYLKLAAYHQHFEACYQLANMLEQQTGIKSLNQEENDSELGKRFKRLAHHYLETKENEWEATCLQLASNFNALEDPLHFYRLAVYCYNGLQPSNIFKAEKAFQYFRLAAQQKFAPAYYGLGKCFEFGKGCTSSEERALEYFKLGAEQNEIRCLHELGLCYQKGLLGLSKCNAKAFEYFQQAADQKSSDDCCIIGFYFEKGLSVPKSLKKAFEYYSISADLGDPQGQYHVARFYHFKPAFFKMHRKESLKMAIGYYLLALDQHHRERKLICRIRSCYLQLIEHSEKSKQNEIFIENTLTQIKSTPFLRNGILEIGEPESAFYLGKFFYQKGKFIQAVYWFQKASRQNDSHSSFQLGLMYEKGVEIPINLDKAIEYFQKVLKTTDRKLLSESFFKLGQCLTCKKDFTQAIECFKKAANLGHIESQYRLSYLYKKGIGAKKSEEQAFKYFTMAKAQKEKEALAHLKKKIISSQTLKSERVMQLQESNRFKIFNQIDEFLSYSNPNGEDIWPLNAQKLDIRPYLKDRQLQTLKDIFQKNKEKAVFLDGYDISWEETIVSVKRSHIDL